MKRMNAILIFTVAILVGILAYMYITYSETFDFAFKESKIDYDDVLATKIAGDEVIIFYVHQFENNTEGLGVCQFIKTVNGWTGSGGNAEAQPSSVTINTLICSSCNPVKVFVYGYINNDEVARIKIMNNDVDKGNAEILDTKWKRVWIKEVDQGTTTIEAYNRNSELIK